MATQSKVQWDNGNPDHPSLVTIFWDDVSLLLTRVVADNTSGLYPLPVKATVTANGRIYEVTVQPGDVVSQVIPTNAANRLQLSINSKGWLDGIDWNIG